MKEMVHARTLVVDQSYQPIRLVCWQRAMSLVLTRKAEVVEEYQDKIIRTVSKEYALPSIIQLKRNAVRIPRVRLARANIYRRDEWTCVYCRERCTETDLTIDHVLPVSQGGGRSWENLVTACRPCNSTKGARTPEQARMRLHTKPRRPGWDISYFFRVNSDDPRTWAQFLGQKLFS